MKENEELNGDIQETAAADTLKPGAGSGGTESKAQMLSTMVQLMNQLGKEDLSDLFNRTIAQIGHEADNIPSNAAAKNLSTIATKEDVDEMFGDELSEEFKEKAQVVFEAAINTRITLEEARLAEEFEAKVAELEEQYEQDLQEQANDIFEDVTAKLDQYLDYALDTWMEENKLAIENSLRAEITEDFISGMQKLFAEHYIEVPSERLDILGEMKAEIDELRGKLNEAIDLNLQLSERVEDSSREIAFGDVAEGLVATDVERLRTLSEGVVYTDDETFRKKLTIIKENYFKKPAASSSTGLITEEIDGTVDFDQEKTGYIAPQISKYVEAISKSVK